MRAYQFSDTRFKTSARFKTLFLKLVSENYLFLIDPNDETIPLSLLVGPRLPHSSRVSNM